MVSGFESSHLPLPLARALMGNLLAGRTVQPEKSPDDYDDELVHEIVSGFRRREYSVYY